MTLTMQQVREYVLNPLCQALVAFTEASQRRQLRRVRMWGETRAQLAPEETPAEQCPTRKA